MKTILSALILALGVLACGETKNGGSTATSLCERAGEGDLVLRTDADVSAAAELTTIAGDLLLCETTVESLALPVLTSVQGNLIAFRNGALTTIDLPLLELVGASPTAVRTWFGLLIEGNAELATVNLPVLRAVTDNVWLAGNGKLTSFDLPALLRADGAVAFKATQLTTITGFGALRTLGNSLAFIDNAALTEVNGFANLALVSNDLLVTNNAELTSLTLPAVRILGRDLEIAETPKLATLALPALAQIGNDLTLTAVAATDLAGLAGLTTIGNDLLLRGDAALTSTALPTLELVGGELVLENAAALPLLSFTGLAFIAGGLSLVDNDLLTTLDLPLLAGLGGNLVVRDNITLPTCAAEGLRDQIGRDNIGGEVSLSGNDDSGVCL